MLPRDNPLPRPPPPSRIRLRALWPPVLPRGRAEEVMQGGGGGFQSDGLRIWAIFRAASSVWCCYDLLQLLLDCTRFPSYHQ